MALLIEHQRLMSGTDSLPSAPVPRVPNTATSQIITGDTIATKQDALDWAISENKAALAQLGAPLIKGQKLVLMKAVTERNKFVPSTSFALSILAPFFFHFLSLVL
jgi:hypothetical protein